MNLIRKAEREERILYWGVCGYTKGGKAATVSLVGESMIVARPLCADEKATRPLQDLAMAIALPKAGSNYKLTTVRRRGGCMGS